MLSSISLARSDGVPDAGIACHFRDCGGNCGNVGNLGKLGELADGSVFFLIRIGFFTIVVSAIIQRAILHIRDGQISVFQNSNHTRKQI